MMTPHGRSTPGPNVTICANSPDRRSALRASFGGSHGRCGNTENADRPG